MERENWRSDPIVVDMYKRLGAELQWWVCDCGAHWLEDHCGPECLNNHSGRFCNWPPEMLKYWDIWNWRARTAPVDYFCPLKLQQVNIVWLTPQQYQEIHKLALAMEAGTLSLSKGIAQMRQIHPGIQPNRHIQLVVKPALAALERIDHKNKIVYFNSTVEEPKS